MPVNLPPMARQDTLAIEEIQFGTGNASGKINVGDYLVYSGHKIIPTALAAANAVAGRASGAGVALEASPKYDSRGVTADNTGLLFAREGRLRVSAFHNFTASGDVTLGAAVYPATTGSGVNAPTGLTGVGAQWGTAARVHISANPTGAPPLGIGYVVGVNKIADGFGATGSGVAQLDIVFFPSRPDYV